MSKFRKLAVLAALVATITFSNVAVANITWSGPATFFVEPTDGIIASGALTVSGPGGLTDLTDGFVYTDVILDYIPDPADGVVSIFWVAARSFTVTGGPFAGAITSSEFGGQHSVLNAPVSDFVHASLTTSIGFAGSVSTAFDDSLEPVDTYQYSWSDGPNNSAPFLLSDGTYTLTQFGEIRFDTNGSAYRFTLPGSAVSLVAVPAPEAAGLVFVGLGLIGWFRRRIA